MKALSTTILIVVTAIVILVAALVVLTIFGGGIGQVSSLTSFENNCRIQCSTTCQMGALPPTWDVQVKVGNDMRTCRSVVADCNACLGTTASGTKYDRACTAAEKARTPSACHDTVEGGKTICFCPP